jgi:hypothetical protein
MKTLSIAILYGFSSVALARGGHGGGGHGGGGHSSGGHISSGHTMSSRAPANSHLSSESEASEATHLGSESSEAFNATAIGAVGHGSIRVGANGNQTVGVLNNASIGVTQGGRGVVPAVFAGTAAAPGAILSPGGGPTTLLIPGTRPSPLTTIHVYGPASNAAFLPGNQFGYAGPEDAYPIPMRESPNSFGCDRDFPVRVWPIDADVAGHMAGPVCADAELITHPAVGMDAADWFNFDPGEYPCRRWKTYAVDPEREVKLTASRDDLDESTAELRILERSHSRWDLRKSYLLAGWGGDAYYYTPERSEIRVDVPPSATIHLKICQKAPQGVSFGE